MRNIHMTRTPPSAAASGTQRITGTQLICKAKEQIFSQGDRSDAIFFIETGKVKLTVVSRRGREAIIGYAGPSDFFGEQCLTGERSRAMSAAAVEDSVFLKIGRTDMQMLLRQDPQLSESFISHLLSRNLRLQDDLVDHFFNHSEKRLARILLWLAHCEEESKIREVSPGVTQETLAEMVGTTRGRISFFMNRFRDEGFIEYKHGGSLCVRNTLFKVLFRD